ncbi:MAG: metal-dependent hydrolase, partial [Victivallaceae bacterium]
THVLSGWCLSNFFTLTVRERFFCMLAAGLPDLDGITYIFGHEAYWDTHHIMGHNFLFAIIASLILSAFSTSRIKCFSIYIALFHLHLLMDLFGSGMGWGIAYYWPFSKRIVEISYYWELYSWQNILAGIFFIGWTWLIILQKKRTPLEYIMPELDRKLTTFFNKKRTDNTDATELH